MTKTHAGTMGVVEANIEDMGFHEMLDHQIIEYRKLVGFQRLELSIQEGRMVSWAEAEREVSARQHKMAAA